MAFSKKQSNLDLTVGLAIETQETNHDVISKLGYVFGCDMSEGITFGLFRTRQ
jgi:hypothetical protein